MSKSPKYKNVEELKEIVRKLREQGQTVVFTAVVTDPDGIEDLIGGTLEDPTTGGTYGAIATSASEGSYS